MILYGLKNCDTCRKALKTLLNAGQDFTFFDIRSDGIPPETLARAIDLVPPNQLLNTRSATWRNLSADQRDLPLFELLANHPTLIKRPLIEANGVFTVGWNAHIQHSLLSSNASP